MFGAEPTADDIREALDSIEATCVDSEGNRWHKIEGEWGSVSLHEDGSVTFRDSEHHPLTVGHEVVQSRTA